MRTPAPAPTPALVSYGRDGWCGMPNAECQTPDAGLTGGGWRMADNGQQMTLTSNLELSCWSS